MKNSTKRKLLKLANFLERKVQEDWFNINVFAHSGFDKKECGTAACAAGWATQCFWFSGLRLKPADGNSEEMQLHYRDREGLRAVTEFFDLTHHEASYLFHPDYYPAGGDTTKQNVIARMRNFVENRGEMPAKLWKTQVTFDSKDLARLSIMTLYDKENHNE